MKSVPGFEPKIFASYSITLTTTPVLAVFDYPKNLTLFDTKCKKVLGSLLLVVRFDYGVWCATFNLP